MSEKLYRFIKASERLPEKKTVYFCKAYRVAGLFTLAEIQSASDEYKKNIEWLEEIEQTTDFDSMRVQQAKERIVYKEALEKIVQHFKDHGWKSHEAMNIANEALART